MNNVSLIGRIAMDAKVGTSVVNSLLAIKRIYKSNDGIDADFVPIVLFGHQADNFSRLTHKGQKIGIDGSIKTSKYADQNGKIKYGFTVAVNHFYLINDKPKSSQVANLNSKQIEELSSQQVAASKQAEVTVSGSDLPF